jgi:hypothetical protein
MYLHMCSMEAWIDPVKLRCCLPDALAEIELRYRNGYLLVLADARWGTWQPVAPSPPTRPTS